jgi:hypothetical protein
MTWIITNLRLIPALPILAAGRSALALESVGDYTFAV